MGALQKTLVYCARAYWGLALVYLILPFASGVRAGAPAFSGFLLGAVVVARWLTATSRGVPCMPPLARSFAGWVLLLPLLLFPSR